MTEKFDVVNGRLIVSRFFCPGDSSTRDGDIILAFDGSERCKWVTAWLGRGDRQWAHGHYFQDVGEAVEDFFNRSRRGGIERMSDYVSRGGESGR